MTEPVDPPAVEDPQPGFASVSDFPLGPILFLTSIFFVNFISRIILSPLMPAIEKDLAIDHSEAGGLFLMMAAGYFVTFTGSGYVSSRVTHRKTIIFSAAAIGIAFSIASAGNEIWGLRIGATLVGMAAGLYLPSGIAVLTSLVDPLRWGKAIAVHELAPNLAFIVAPLLSELLLVWFSWRFVLLSLGGASLLLSIIFARFGAGGRFPGEPPAFKSLRALFVMPSFWIMVVLFCLAIAGSSGIYSVLPLYLVAGRGMEQEWANTLVGVSRIACPPIALLSGWAADRFGYARTMACGLLLTGVSTILAAIVPQSWMITVILLQAMLSVCFFAPGLASLAMIAPAGARNVVVSFAVPFGFLIGAGVAPAMIGFAGKAGTFEYGFTAAGGIIILGSFLCRFLKLSPSADEDRDARSLNGATH